MHSTAHTTAQPSIQTSTLRNTFNTNPSIYKIQSIVDSYTCTSLCVGSIQFFPRLWYRVLCIATITIKNTVGLSVYFSASHDTKVTEPSSLVNLLHTETQRSPRNLFLLCQFLCHFK